MSDTRVDVAEELESFAVSLARGAANVVRGAAGGDVPVDTKSTATDLVTAVDRQTEAWLIDQIGARRPDDAVLGEEGGRHAGRGRVRWILDPIDGTVNFVLGLPHYGVSVAAELDGVVVAGAVCNPASGELFHARAGSGAYLDGTRLGGRRDVPLARAVIGTGFGYDAALRARQATVVSALLPVIADIRRAGSASLDLCSVAAGRLDAYFEAGLNLWDYAAGALIATEAGCVVSGGRRRAPGPHLVAVAPPALAGEFLDVLAGLGADRVNT